MIDTSGKARDHRRMDTPRQDMIARLDAFQTQAQAGIEGIKSGMDRQHAASAAALRERGAHAGKRIVAIAACMIVLSMAVLAAAFALALD